MSDLSQDDDSALGRWLAEEQRLTKFFTKLLGEALHLEADTIHFALDGESLTGSIRRAKTELKSVALKASWFNLMAAWLLERTGSIFGAPDEGVRPTVEKNGDWIGRAVVRVGESLVLFKVRRQAGLTSRLTMQLSEFTVLQLSRGIEQIGISEALKASFEQIADAGSGILLLSAPDDHQLKRAVATMLSATAAVHIGPLSDPDVIADAPRLSSRIACIVSCISSDLADTILKARQTGWAEQQAPIIGAVCVTFVRRICAGCAKKTPVPPSHIDKIPEVIRPADIGSYLVGRGCDQCGHTGYRGMVGIPALVRFTPDLAKQFVDGPDVEELVEKLHQRGARALMESGIKLALEGGTTFESLFESVRSTPQPWIELARKRLHAKHRQEPESLEIGSDFFVSEPGTAFERPLVGRQAFSPKERRTPDDAPIFSDDLLKKARAKPLVLIVEDDADQRSILEMTIRGANFDVILAKDGQEALEILEKQTPDLVLTDLMMPNVDGRQLVQRLRHSPRFADLPVLVLTVITDAEREFDLLSLGADDYCDKTVQRKILLKRIENLLKRSKRSMV